MTPIVIFVVNNIWFSIAAEFLINMVLSGEASSMAVRSIYARC